MPTAAPLTSDLLFTNPSSTCGMINVSPGEDGMGDQTYCLGIAIGTDENGVRVCEKCALQTESEGFAVIRDVSN